MRRHILSRANVVASEATRSDKAPSRCVSIRTPFEPIEGGSVLDGIRPGRRCHFRFGLQKVVAIPHIAVAETKRRAFGLSLRRLSRLICRQCYRCSWRRPPSGSLALTTAAIVERFVDLRRNP